VPIAKRMRDIKPFHVMELLGRAQALEREGRDVVHMEIGEPDFPTPAAVVAESVKFVESGMIKYTPACGLPQLRAALSDYYQRRYGVRVAPSRIFITPGASGAFLLAMGTLVNPGDGVLLADPGYPCYGNFVHLFGGMPQSVAVEMDSGFQLNADLLERSWQSRTTGVILASPSNPTGTLAGRGALSEMVQRVERRGGFFISDEIYHGLEYGEPSHSALEFSDDIFVVNSFSKYFGMTGWRLGWLIAPESHAEALEKLAQNIFISAPALSQAAALAAFSEQNLEELERRRLEFRSRRDFLCTELSRIGFGIPVKPEGAFYVYADCTGLNSDSFDFAWRLLEEAHVAVTPGRDFGENRPESYLRFSYTTSLERLALGVERIAEFIARFC
jgi:aspartate/methionine/tyrosine aminotransferase